MASKDLHNNIRLELANTMFDITTDTPHLGIVRDIEGAESVEILCIIGEVAGAGTVTAQLSESDDPTFTTSNLVAATDILGTQPVFDQLAPDIIRSFGYIGFKRYLRLDYIPAGVSGGQFHVGAYTQQYWLHHAPAA